MSAETLQPDEETASCSGGLFIRYSWKKSDCSIVKPLLITSSYNYTLTELNHGLLTKITVGDNKVRPETTVRSNAAGCQAIDLAVFPSASP